MARVNVYLPDELAKEARAAGVNVSQVAQEALRAELRKRAMNEWLDRVAALPPTGITHEQVLAAIDEGREEFGRRG